MSRKVSLCIAILLSCMTATFAEENSNVKITPSGFAYYQLGQMMKITPFEANIQKAFDQHFNGRLTLNAVINDRLQVIVGAEGEFGASINDNAQKKNPIYLKEAQGIYSFGDPANSFLQIAAGYFPFKYNPEARNLGEYLYRTGSYPGYIISDFDFAKTRLMGFRVSSTLFNQLKLDALFTSEYSVSPWFDYSLAFVAGYKPLGNLFDLGAGIDFDRLIPIDKNATTNPNNIVMDKDNNPVIENGDTLRYTMRGTKLMGRLTFDPKQFIPFSDMLGPDDAKLYGEIAFLGLKNYGVYYSDIWKRVPLMFGFNIPCFRMLDVMSLEFEYYGADPAYKIDVPASPNPMPNPSDPGLRSTPWKWSLFVQKTLIKGLALKGLIARDHFRTMDGGGNYDPVERMRGQDDWHYKLRIMYSF